ncbi:MAG: DNA-binding protein [Ardenticatenaceae bacterium]|nr:DNA-binding protein [Ardenticatenaceae bacterium]
MVDAHLIQISLISWGKENFRQFPWRVTRDPYKILLSEVMLHRTQAIQVVPVYKQFVNIYPDLPTMTQASKSELHNILYSLGLRWRIDMLHQMGSDVVRRFDGKIPVAKEDLQSLPGVSEYIAGAVRVFSWNLPEALADTNTIRVIGRLFGLKIKDSSRRNRLFRDLLLALLDLENPRLYNYALLDLADKVCMKKQEPACEQCPLKSWCLYAQQNN